MTVSRHSLVIRLVLATAISLAAVTVIADPASAANKPKLCDFRTGIGCTNDDGTSNGPSATITKDGQQALDKVNGVADTSAATATTGFNASNILKLSGWLEWLALLSCIIGICISSALWALGSKGQNPGQELTGKKGLILCCTAAFFIGALPGMLNWLEAEAKDADTTGVVGDGGGGTIGDGSIGGTGGAGNLNPNVANGGNAEASPGIGDVRRNPVAATTNANGSLACTGARANLYECKGAA